MRSVSLAGPRGPTRHVPNLQRFNPGVPDNPAGQVATDDIELVPPQPAGNHHPGALWHHRGTGAHAVFYRGYGVPDTVNGRFDMIVLHLALVLDRTETADESLRVLGQGVFDLFCREMDGHFREAGVSDLKVPKEMREMAEAFYGRRSAYRAALAAPGNDALEAALMRNVYLGAARRRACRGAACGLCPCGVARSVARKQAGRRTTRVARSGRHLDRDAGSGTRMRR